MAQLKSIQFLQLIPLHPENLASQKLNGPLVQSVSEMGVWFFLFSLIFVWFWRRECNEKEVSNFKYGKSYPALIT